MDLVSMDIFRLFDRAKYFRIEFDQASQDDPEIIQNLIHAALDMDRKVEDEAPVIKKGEIHIDCDHSLTYAKMTLVTANQKGLMAHVIDIFDDFGIDISTAKISTIKNRASDLFLIEKSAHFCDNYKKIVTQLTK